MITDKPSGDKVCRQVYESTDFASFVPSEDNRIVKDKDFWNVIKLMERAKRFMEEFPIIVFWNECRKRQIIDGEHRFHGSKYLYEKTGDPAYAVKYVYGDPDVDYFVYSDCHKDHSLENALANWAKSGDVCCQQIIGAIKGWRTRTEGSHINPTAVARLLSGLRYGSKQQVETALTEKKFEVTDHKLFGHVTDIAWAIHGHNKKLRQWNSDKFLLGLGALCLVHRSMFDPAEMIRSVLASPPDDIKHCITHAQYVEMFASIYHPGKGLDTARSTLLAEVSSVYNTRQADGREQIGS